MHRYYIVRLLLFPSFLGGIVTLAATLVLAVTSGILYVTENQLFYDYLFGSRGVNTVLLQAPDGTSAVWAAIVNSSFAYYTLLLAVAVISGLTLFAILQGISRIRSSAGTFGQARLAQKQFIQETFHRLLIRVIAFMSAIIYLIFFVNIFMPFCSVLLQTGIDSFELGVPLEGTLYLAATGLLLAVGLHVLVIFARLTLLRPRLLGGADVQLATIDN